ncbi:hypothetical protein SALBM311S_01212 [Streptomyces alboniger]
MVRAHADRLRLERRFGAAGAELFADGFQMVARWWERTPDVWSWTQRAWRAGLEARELRTGPLVISREAERLLLPRSTFYTRMQELGLTEQLKKTTRRRSREASKPRRPYTPSVALRPGQLVQIDTSPLKIKVIGDDGRAVSAELTAAIDVASRSCMALMIVPVVTGEGKPGSASGAAPPRRSIWCCCWRSASPRCPCGPAGTR